MTQFPSSPCGIIRGNRVAPRGANPRGRGHHLMRGSRMVDSTTPPRRPSIRVNLMWAHGTEYQYRRGGCRCAMCRRGHNLAQRPWSVAHRADYYARVRQCRSDNPARYAEYLRRFFERHPGYSLTYRRQWIKKNKEAHRAHSRNHHAKKLNAVGTHNKDDVLAQYQRQRGRCFWCACQLGSKYDVDHVVPLALGGSNGRENIVVACQHCNRGKRAQHPMDFAGVML